MRAVVGSFMLGLITPRRNDFARSLAEHFEDLTFIILLPFYYTFTVIRTDIGTLKYKIIIYQLTDQ